MRLNLYFRYAIYGVFSLLFLSGNMWLIADGKKDGAGGEAWQAVSATLLMVHGGAAMSSMLLTGALFPVHISRAWRAKRNRVTGSAMVALAAALILTAFGLYYLGGETVRPWTSSIHLTAGLVLPLLILFHIVAGRRTRSRERPESTFRTSGTVAPAFETEEARHKAARRTTIREALR